MALFKCPECGKDVSTAAEACPHCGYPIKKEAPKATKVIKEQLEDYPEPKDSSWIEIWKDKAKQTKIIWAVIFATNLLLLTLSLILMFNDTDNPYTFKTVHAVFANIFGFSIFIVLVLLIAVLISVKVRARQYEGYTVLVYVGFKNLLIVEDEIQDQGIINRFLYGQLPNKKQVWVSISAWDGSVKMGIGNTGDEKNLI